MQRESCNWPGWAGAPRAGLCGSAGDLSQEPGGSGGSGASPGLSRGVFQHGLSPTSLSGRGELDLLFHFLGSAFGTAGWLRPRRAPDSHLGETDKGRIFCQQNPAQLPWNRAGRGGGALWRKDREIHLLPMERRGEEREEGRELIQSCSGEIPVCSAKGIIECPGLEGIPKDLVPAMCLCPRPGLSHVPHLPG